MCSVLLLFVSVRCKRSVLFWPPSPPNVFCAMFHYWCALLNCCLISAAPSSGPVTIEAMLAFNEIQTKRLKGFLLKWKLTHFPLGRIVTPLSNAAANKSLWLWLGLCFCFDFFFALLTLWTSSCHAIVNCPNSKSSSKFWSGSFKWHFYEWVISR